MQSLASFSAKRTKRSYILAVDSFRRDNRRLVFQFDTGASMSLVGLNTVCDDDEGKAILARIILEEVAANGIEEEKEFAKTATNEEVGVYPCRLSGVSIMNTKPRDLYFHVYLGDVNLPLLGFDFTDYCDYHHRINGDIEVTAISDYAGRDC